MCEKIGEVGEDRRCVGEDKRDGERGGRGGVRGFVFIHPSTRECALTRLSGCHKGIACSYFH